MRCTARRETKKTSFFSNGAFRTKHDFFSEPSNMRNFFWLLERTAKQTAERTAERTGDHQFFSDRL